MRKFTILLFCLLSPAVFGQSVDLCVPWTFSKGIEGAAHDKQGNIYAVSFKKDGTIGQVKNGKARRFVTLPKGSTGNGIVFDSAGNMYIADYTGHNVLLIRAGSRRVEVYAHESQMNQPNDLAISPSGNLYASDPNWANGTGQLWLVRQDRSVTLLEANMGTTNGIEVSPDGRKLYVGESAQLKVWVYDIAADGTVSNKRLFKVFHGDGMDGMRCDDQGNLWIARYDKGTVAAVDPQGETIKEVTLQGRKCSNLTLYQGKGYVTMADRGCFEVIVL